MFTITEAEMYIIYFLNLLHFTYFIVTPQNIQQIHENVKKTSDPRKKQKLEFVSVY